MSKYFIPYSVTRCFFKSMRNMPLKWYPIVGIFMSLFIVFETVTLPILPLITWIHWTDSNSDREGLCYLREMYKKN